MSFARDQSVIFLGAEVSFLKGAEVSNPIRIDILVVGYSLKVFEYILSRGRSSRARRGMGVFYKGLKCLLLKSIF